MISKNSWHLSKDNSIYRNSFCPRVSNTMQPGKLLEVRVTFGREHMGRTAEWRAIPGTAGPAHREGKVRESIVSDWMACLLSMAGNPATGGASRLKSAAHGGREVCCGAPVDVFLVGVCRCCLVSRNVQLVLWSICDQREC